MRMRPARSLMAPTRRIEKPLSVGALAASLLSCIPMMFASFAALGVALGVTGATVIATPFDDFLATWALPILVVSLAILVFAIRRGPRLALAMAVVGGVTSVIAMFAMGDMRAMSGMARTAPTGRSLVLGLLFLVSSAMLIVATFIAWRARPTKDLDA